MLSFIYIILYKFEVLNIIYFYINMIYLNQTY